MGEGGGEGGKEEEGTVFPFLPHGFVHGIWEGREEGMKDCVKRRKEAYEGKMPRKDIRKEGN